MNELRIEVHQTPGEIACNFDEIEAALKNQMTAYEELEVTEENIPERKADVATLRKISKAVDDERKRVKKEFSAPLTEFEGRVKRLTEIIGEQITRINAGLTEFEDKRIQEKREHVKEIYAAEVGDLAEFMPYEVIRSSRWDNKTTSDNEIISEIQTMKLRIKSDLESIKALESDIEDKLILAYKATGNNLSAAIQKHTDYMAGKAAAMERTAAEQTAPTACQPAEPVKVWDSMNEPELIVKVKGLENIEALKTYLDMSGMEWEEIR